MSIPKFCEIESQQQDLNRLFKAMRIKASCIGTTNGLRTRDYHIKLELGEKVSKVRALGQEIALALRSITTPVIELDSALGVVKIITTINDGPIVIPFSSTIKNLDLSTYQVPLLAGLKMDGEPLVLDLASAPHILTAGTTGAGKSVLMRSMLETIIAKNQLENDDTTFCLLDPKLTELKKYAKSDYCTFYGTNYDHALELLTAAVRFMDDRYKDMERLNLSSFAELKKLGKNPYVVIIIDEFADLILQDKKEMLKTALIRLLQKSRAAGIHIIANTQRPSREVVCGLIKANMPVQIALKCATNFDSRTILGEEGAEKLVGKGDMLVKLDGKTIRAQATFI